VREKKKKNLPPNSGRYNRFHSTSSVLSFLAGIPPVLQFGIIFTHILFAKGVEKVRRAHISLKYLFLAIHAKVGESISPKQKDRTTQSKNTAPPLIFKI
jgi:hypothetical protein